MWVPIDSIYVGERARKDLGDLEEIEESAKDVKIGQIQSIAVEPISGDLTKTGKQYSLIAGARRLAAFKKAGVEKVFIRLYEGLDGHTRKRIELIENKARLDMAWPDQVALEDEIHRLYVDIHGEKVSSQDKTGWSQTDTAKATGRSTASVSRDLKLAKAMKDIPELGKCKTRSEAEKLLDKLQEKLIIDELAKRESTKRTKEESTGVDAIRARLYESYILSDVFEGLRGVTEKSVDFIDLDPPYGIDMSAVANRRPDRNSAVEAYEAQQFAGVERGEYIDFLQRIMAECWRIMKPNSWLIVWYAPNPWADVVFNIIKDAGFTISRDAAIWLKNRISRNVNPKMTFSRQYESFYYAKKGSAVLMSTGHSNVFTADIPGQGQRIHPTEKPVELMKDILGCFVPPGAQVLVPFLGSGSTLIAAEEKQMSAFGFDCVEDFRNRFVMKVQNWRARPVDLSSWANIQTGGSKKSFLEEEL